MRYYLFNGFDDIISFVLGDILADRKPERAVRYVVYPSYRKQHMARVKRSRGAGASRGSGDSLLVEQEQNALALDALKAEIDVAGETLCRVAVERAVGYLGQALDDVVADLR